MRVLIILVAGLFACVLIGAMPAKAASSNPGPDLQGVSKTKDPAGQIPASIPDTTAPALKVHVETYLFLGQDTLTFNNGVDPVLDMLPASGDDDQAPLSAGPTFDRSLAE